ncbi:MAG: bifunctional imidazole glycerol-phosphate dehydratase/histidinol phosphatase [Flavobacteriaceae bacterium TMED171]|nr:bifunctional histidinol-phosphatase/imidazoleglycerol-phosphate dehydratase [Flavobacteriaceae bacterium]OUW31803.1 MAG: bifunctional imidazole glycerol-phosphate dehydratase/histidinol phosphatase [Flavobacteriaceae bacterium TMED171]
MKKVLFIDRDGTLTLEPVDYQVDDYEKLVFYPKVFRYLGNIARELGYELVMVTNQDGLGTDKFPEEEFWPYQNHLIKSFKNEGVVFSKVFIDRTFPEDQADTRKPGAAMLTAYLDNPDYDLSASYVIGDRLTDMQLAKNLGAKGIFIDNNTDLGADEVTDTSLEDTIALTTKSWEEIYRMLLLKERAVVLERNTKETQIFIELNLDGTGKAQIDTGIAFFDHMIDQLTRHGGVDLTIKVQGDLEVDEHHTIEDTAIALGESFAMALGDKKGIERYGFTLPMDDTLAQVVLDFGGRSWLVWEAEFKREMIGQMPTEMFYHFFKSFADGAKANINIKVEGSNEHHKIESVFKAFAKAIKMAIKRDEDKMILPSTKGTL